MIKKITYEEAMEYVRKGYEAFNFMGGQTGPLDKPIVVYVREDVYLVDRDSTDSDEYRDLMKQQRQECIEFEKQYYKQRK